MNRKLYTRMLQILFAVLLSLATACDEDNGGGNEDPKPSKFSVTLSVKDVSASTASVETTPNDNTVHYFCDAVTKAEYDKAGEDAFIAGLLESYEVQLEEGETFAQFWEKKSKRGKGSWTLSRSPWIPTRVKYYRRYSFRKHSRPPTPPQAKRVRPSTGSRCLPQPRIPKRNSKWSCKSPMRRKYMH